METKDSTFSRVRAEHRQHNAVMVYCECGMVEDDFGAGVAKVSHNVVDGNDVDLCIGKAKLLRGIRRHEGKIVTMTIQSGARRARGTRRHDGPPCIRRQFSEYIMKLPIQLGLNASLLPACNSSTGSFTIIFTSTCVSSVPQPNSVSLL